MISQKGIKIKSRILHCTTYHTIGIINKAIDQIMKILLFLITLTSVSGFCQMLDNRNGSAFTDQPFFNTEFIRINKIKVLNGAFTYKKPGEMMRVTEYKYVYNFDESGRLTSSFETRQDDGTEDTIRNEYVYTDENLLLEHKKGDKGGFTSTRYEYDEKARIIKVSHQREYRDSLDSLHITIMNSETMVYEDYETQTKKTVFNSYGFQYMHEFSYSNDLGYLIRKEERYLMTGELISHIYEYNDKGLLSAIKSIKNVEETPFEEILFTYDENDNLTEKQYSRDGEHITETEILFNEQSKLLVYVITRDVATNFIMILSFKDYQFYE